MYLNGFLHIMLRVVPGDASSRVARSLLKSVFICCSMSKMENVSLLNPVVSQI